MKNILFGCLDADMRAVLRNIPYEVDYVITNVNVQSEFEGKKVFTSIKLFDEEDSVFIYVTDLENYAEIARQLLVMGFVEGKDFAGANEYVYNQWEKNEYFDDTFVVRISHLARLISSDSASIMDLGCGPQKLRAFLRPEVEYIGVDYKDRGNNTVICDFNKKEFPDQKTDTIFVSGCLEYIEDVEWFCKNIAEHSKKELILSYCPLEYKSDIRERRKLGWKNHMSMSELREMLQRFGFEISFGEKSVGCNMVFSFKNVRGGVYLIFKICAYPIWNQKLWVS